MQMNYNPYQQQQQPMNYNPVFTNYPQIAQNIPQSREDLTHSLSLENWMESLTEFAMVSML